jgi:hypothetical protein
MNFILLVGLGFPPCNLGSIRTWEEGGRQARRFDPVRPCVAPRQAMPRCISRKGKDNIDKDLHTTSNGAVGRRQLGHSMPLVEAPA